MKWRRRGGNSGPRSDCRRSGCSRETPLHAAALRGNARVATWLLDHGADPGHRLADDVGRQAGWTPMHSAAWRGSVEIVRLLMEKGESSGEACGDGGLRRTPLHIACRGWLPVVRVMLDPSLQKDPDLPMKLLRTTDSNGNTPLHFAVSKEATPTLELVRFLISAGAPLDVMNNDKMTPLMLCEDPENGGRDEAIARLLRESR